MRSTHIGPFVSILFIAMYSSLFAAKPVALENTSLSDVQAEFNVQLPGMQKSIVQSPNAMNYLKHRTDKNQVTHTRMQQTYWGFPVFGGYGIIHSLKPVRFLLTTIQMNKAKMNGVLYKGLQDELGKPAASFESNAKKALEVFKKKYSNHELRDEQSDPIIYIDYHHRAHWAYKVSVYIEHKNKIPERAMAIIAADTYKPFIEWNDIKTIDKLVKGLGFGGNERTQKYEYGNDRPGLKMNRNEDSGTCYMENPGVKVVDMDHAYNRRNVPMAFKCIKPDPTHKDTYWTGYQADGYDQQNGGYSPTNDALYTGYVINNMYKEWFDLAVITKAGKPTQLIMRVHYGSGYENAFWDGKQMTFGDGDKQMHPLVSIGIGAHEISHGFTEQHSNLMYFGQSGAINEAFSDMAAQAAEYYANKQSSWEIGSDVIKADSSLKALRYMKKPSMDGHSIDTANQYHSGLDVHFASGVFNRLFYLMATNNRWDTKKAFHVMVKANMDYWTPYTDFQQGGCGIINAASDLGYSVEDVKQALDEVTIDHQKCTDNSMVIG